MTAIAAGVIAIWDGANASIPANFTRATALDGRYPRGSAVSVNPGGGGGSSMHTHAELGDGHSHTLPSHGHNPGGATSSASGTTGVVTSTGTAQTLAAALNSHIHSLPSGGNNAALTVAGTPGWATGASDPPTTYSVIWVQSNGSPTGFANQSLVFWYQPALPTGWTQLVIAVSGITQPVYLIGASTGADGGGIGGTTTAGHQHTGTAHTHVFASHAHGSVASGSVSASFNTAVATVGAVSVASTHTHAATYATSGSVTSGSGANSACAAAVYEPPYTVLTIMRNTSGAASFPAYCICLWLGTLATIPAGWSLCDGTNGTPDMRTQFVRGSLNLTDIGATGGAQGHQHDPPTVVHTHDLSHSHSITVAGDTEFGAVADGAANSLAASGTHTHSGSTSDTYSGGTSGDTIPTVSQNADTRPPYTDVAFIMYTAAPTVSITAPANNASESLPSFSVSWAFDVLRTQVTYELLVYAADGVTVVYDSGPQLSASLTATIPAGYLVNNSTYKLKVIATDSGHGSATSPLITITTSWTDPPTPGSVSISKVGGT